MRTINSVLETLGIILIIICIITFTGYTEQVTDFAKILIALTASLLAGAYEKYKDDKGGKHE